MLSSLTRNGWQLTRPAVEFPRLGLLQCMSSVLGPTRTFRDVRTMVTIAGRSRGWFSVLRNGRIWRGRFVVTVLPGRYLSGAASTE